MESFAKKIIELRKLKGISQEEMACDLQISQSTVSNYESGVTNPDTEILKKIADYFQVPVSYLFSDEKFVFETHENNGGNSGYMVNSTLNIMSEKLIELYEMRLKEKEEEIVFLKNLIEKKN